MAVIGSASGLTGRGSARRCALCGVRNHICSTPTTVTPIDEQTTEATMDGALHQYDVTVNGTRTVMNLTERDAKRYPDAKRRGRGVDKSRSAPTQPAPAKAPAPKSK